MAKFEDGEYILTIKEKDTCILNSIWDKRVIYYPYREYKLIVEGESYTYFNELGTEEALHTDNFLSCFNIKKVA